MGKLDTLVTIAASNLEMIEIMMYHLNTNTVPIVMFNWLVLKSGTLSIIRMPVNILETSSVDIFNQGLKLAKDSDSELVGLLDSVKYTMDYWILKLRHKGIQVTSTTTNKYVNLL